MNRQHWLKRFWPTIFSVVCTVNIFTMFPQIYKIVVFKNVSGLSLGTLLIYLIVQISFAINGKFQNDKRQFMFLVIASIFTTTTIILYLIYR
jgi:uncharacterized protein with PQ loop repeat